MIRNLVDIVVGLGTFTLAVLALVGSSIAAIIVVLVLKQAGITGDTADTEVDVSEADPSTDPARDVDAEIEVDGEGGDGEYETEVIDDISEVQLGKLAPANVAEDEDNYEYIRTGKDTFIRGYFISGWPETMNDGQLQDLFAQSGLEADVAIPIDPIPTPDALDRLKSKVEELRADVQLLQEDGNTVEAEDTARELRDYRGMRDTIRDSDAELFDVGFYTSVVGETKDELDAESDRLEELLASNGLQATLHTKNQEATHRSVTPTLTDDIEMKQSMMSAAIGAMMPFSSGTLLSESGIPIGEHAENGSPIIYDRFDHERGYNWLTIGNIGAGKSFSTKLHLLRRRLYDPDTIIIMLDPLQGFAGINTALNGKHVTVGGTTGLNPLEIKRVPDEVLENNPELNPGAAKLKDLRSFFESFFELRDDDLGELWDTLQRALQTAYERRGIDLNDPSTHDRENPTIQDDLVPVLLDMVTDEQEHSILTDIADDDTLSEVFEEATEVTEEERRRASELLLAMEAFLEGNALGNLGTHSSFEFGDEEVVWLDLQQQEGRGSLGLMMNLLFSAVYERAKQSDKNIIFAIDEARYIMRDKAALEFLEQAVRHSRHYDLSIQFITQTIDEFFQHEEAKAIADQCDHKLFFHTEGLDEEVAEKVGMNPVQASFARQATPGDEDTGYSEAVFGVSDYGWYPVHIRAMDQEAAVVDLEPEMDIEAALPGMIEGEDVPLRVKQLRDRLLDQHMSSVAAQNTEPMIPEKEIETEDGDTEHIADPSQLSGSGEMEKYVAKEIVDDNSESPNLPFDPNEQTPAEIRDRVSEIDDLATLNQLYKAETDGENRPTATRHLTDRIEQLADDTDMTAEPSASSEN